MLLLPTTRTPTPPLSSFAGTNDRAPPKQLSSLTNRNHLVPSSTSARMTATPQTSLTLSTPIIHSNGKPLKHSLKSSHSSPHIPGVCLHQRAQSEPVMSAGGSVKNVHFAGEESLSAVRVFSASRSRSMDPSGRQRMTLKRRPSTIRPAFQTSLQTSPSRSWVRAAASLTPPSNSLP